MPVRRIAPLIPRQTSIATSSTSSADTTTPSLTDTLASTIATSAPPTTLPTIPGTITNGPASSSTSSESLSLSSAQLTSSQDVSTTSTTTTPSQSESSTSILTSDIRISSTSPDVLTSTFTSQQSISSASSTSSVSSPPPPSSPAPTTSTYIPTPTSTNGGQMTSYSTSSYVTVVGTSTFTTYSLIPTTISSDVSNNSAGNRTSIIAGSVIGGGLLLILTLSIFFYRQRQRFKRFHSLDIMNVHRRQARARATLLAGEDLDDVTLSHPPPGRYTDYDSPWDLRDSSGSLGDSQRGTLVDPLMRSVDIDLSHIVDDVMGPSFSGADMHYYQNSVSSSYRGFPGRDETMTGGNSQTGELSNASQIALLDAAGLARPTPPSPPRKSEGENDAIGAGIDTGGQL